MLKLRKGPKVFKLGIRCCPGDRPPMPFRKTSPTMPGSQISRIHDKYKGYSYTLYPHFKMRTISSYHRRHLILSHKLSYLRLSLSVVDRFLKSLVEATPNWLGATYLVELHALVFPSGMGIGDPPTTCKGKCLQKYLVT